MIKNRFKIIIAILGSLFLVMFFVNFWKKQSSLAIVAIVNETSISKDQLITALFFKFSTDDKNSITPFVNPKLLNNVLKNLIDEQLILDGAKEAGLLVNEKKINYWQKYYLEKIEKEFWLSLSKKQRSYFQKNIENRLIISNFILYLSQQDLEYDKNWVGFWQTWQNEKIKPKYLVRILLVNNASDKVEEIYQDSIFDLNLEKLERKYQMHHIATNLSKTFWLYEENINKTYLSKEQLENLEINKKIPMGTYSQLFTLNNDTMAIYEFLSIPTEVNYSYQLGKAFLFFEIKKQNYVLEKWFLKKRNLSKIEIMTRF